MIEATIAHQRMHHQQIVDHCMEKPADVVEWFGAIQAQDYAGAKWGIGLRMKTATDAAIEQAFNEGEILRTHVLRPTWHFVTPADIRWMLALTAPRVKARTAYYSHGLGLDASVFRRSNAAIEKALRGGKQMTRGELIAVLKRARVDVGDPLRVGHILLHAELDGLLCSGARRGKQHTYALLDERAAQARTLERDEALAELAKRYLTSRGPATVQDYAWWSGLTTADAQAGIEIIKGQLSRQVIDGKTYWQAAGTPSVPADRKKTETMAHLLPNYDEYLVAYTDRSAVFDESQRERLNSRDHSLLANVMVRDGEVVGTWKRVMEHGAAAITLQPLRKLNAVENRAFAAAVRRYGEFLGQNATVSVERPG